MPFDGNGNYRFPVNSWNPAVNGNQASAQDWMAIINDLSTSLSSVVLADGQKMMTGNLRMGGFKLTGIGAAVDPTDAIRRAQIQKGAEIASAATIEIPSEGSLFSVNGDKNLEGINGGYDGQSFALVFSNAVTLKNSERLKTSTGLDIKAVVGHPYNFVRLATDRWFVFEINQIASSVPFTPVGGIAATTVQAAIKELDDEKQPKGNYQPALGFTPVNKAGDTMSGALVAPTLHGWSQVTAGQNWNDWSATVRLDLDSVYLQNGFNRHRMGREGDGLNFWVYTGTGAYVGRAMRIAGDQVVSFDKNPLVSGRRMTLTGDPSGWTGSVVQIDTPASGYIYDLPWGYAMIGLSIQSVTGDSRVYAIRGSKLTL